MIVIFSRSIQWVHSANNMQKILITIANQVICTKNAIFLSNYKLPDVMQTMPHAFSIPKDVTMKQVEPFWVWECQVQKLECLFNSTTMTHPRRRSRWSNYCNNHSVFDALAQQEELLMKAKPASSSVASMSQKKNYI